MTKKIDNSAQILNKLFSLYEQQEFCDLLVKVGNVKYEAHKMVLCMSSDVFKTMLSSDTWPEGRNNLIILQEEAECAEVFPLFLRYMYKGQIELNRSTVLPLLTLADKYNVADLSSSCLEYIQESCSPSARREVISWLQYSIMCGYAKVASECDKFITQNFESIINTPQFVTMSKPVLLSFLRSSDLVLKNEFSLYVALKKWLVANENDYQTAEEKKIQFESLMKQVRFPMMHLFELAALESDQFISTYKDFYLKKIFAAVKFHTLSEEDTKLSAIKRMLWDIQYTPRNYDTESWSTTITVDNLSRVEKGEVRGAFFTTPSSCSDLDQLSHLDWHVMFYPKGVIYNACVMIGVPNNLVNPGVYIRTVRLALSTQCITRRRFKITVLVLATENVREEFVCSAITKDAIFDKNSTLFNFEDVIPFYDLFKSNSRLKPDLDTLKIKVVIRPVSFF